MQVSGVVFTSVVVFLVSFSQTCNALECYVCTNQTDNTDKCLKTIRTCEYGQDMCLTEIRWGTEPYWSQGADKQYYVSKRCANNDTCERSIRKTLPYCTHIWYEDWKCTECCRGDRCNYFVILGASSLSSSFAVLITCSIGIIAMWWQNVI